MSWLFNTRQALSIGYDSDSPGCRLMTTFVIFIISYVQTMKMQIKNQPLRTEAGRAPLASPSSHVFIISYFGPKSFPFQYIHVHCPKQESVRIRTE